MGRRGGKATLILDSASLSRSFQRRASEADAAAVKGGRAASRGVSAPGARVGCETASEWGGAARETQISFPPGFGPRKLGLVVQGQEAPSACPWDPFRVTGRCPVSPAGSSGADSGQGTNGSR